MRDEQKIGWLLVLWLFIGAATIFFAWASYEECARVHPGWYCIAH